MQPRTMPCKQQWVAVNRPYPAIELLLWLKTIQDSWRGNSRLRLEKHGHLAMAPAEAVAAGRVRVALPHILWQRLHRQIHFAFQLRMSEFIVHMRNLHAECYSTTMDASLDGTIAINIVEMMPRLCIAR